MSETKYLKLFKHDSPPTNKNKFDVQKALNDNWDKSDEFAGKAGAKLNLNINVTDYIMTLQLLNINDEVVDEKTIDFPLESVVVSGRYDKENKKVILTLQNGSEVDFSVGDLIDGLVSQSTFDTEIQKINVEITSIKGRLDTIEEEQTTQSTEIQELIEENKRLREDLNNSTITASNSGENITINDSAEARFKKLKISGNTYQETDDTKPSLDIESPIRNCGDNVNLLDLSKCSFLCCTLNKDNKSITSNLNNDSDYCEISTTELNNKILKSAGKDFTFSIGKVIEERRISFVIYGNRSNGARYQEVNATFSSYVTIKVADDFTSIDRLSLRFNRSKDSSKITDTETTIPYSKLEEGTKATPYSPYGCGNMNFKIQNKNWFNINDEYSKSNEDFKCEIENNILRLTTIKENTVQYVGYIISNLDDSKTYTLSFKARKIIKGAEGNSVIRIAIYYSNDGNDYTYKGAASQSDIISGKEYKLSITFGKYKYCRLYIYNNPGSSTTNIGDITEYYDIQFEENKETEYTPHQEQSFSFPTKEGQVFHKDDYLADNETHHKRKTREFDGTEGWNLSELSAENVERFSLVLSDIIKNPENSLCSHFSYLNNHDDREHFRIGTISGINKLLVIYIKKSIASNLEELKAFLADQKSKGIPLKLEYELEEEIIEPYSPEQQEVWDKIKNTANTYKGVTHIFSEDEISPEFEEEHLVDLEAYINSKLNVQASEPQQEVSSEMPSEEPSIEQPQLEETEVIGGEE